ncbi:Ca2+/Na+ antiporter [Thermococcus cleftensis]|uniref:Ca2+/Na+ antiporter n=1 Tax=Thermococcus cleftensis (strain DSM 27260 / KACC 17922 / CL1) TaxID=163003 RepID=I3ZW23_THECF|nr:calcium/sodium antiporter [Thermococcus cleftensis]AFL95907.1 Ca2+/Na+ antiporter [Thermococcus cleftensis]
MIVEIILFAVGLVLLIKGSDYFVEAASRVAKGFGVSEFIIALVLASIATTLPEVTVSAISSYQGNPDIALGNAIGSALANIALILGVSALLRPLSVEKTAWKNSLFMVGVTAYAGLLMYDGTIGRLDGLSLILIYFGFLYYLYRKHMTLEELPEGGRGNPRRDALIMLASGLVVVTGAKLVVDSAVTIARAYGVPEVVIGLTMVSIGTSLPEFTNSLMATIKRLPNISVGNIIGANILDVLMVIGIASLINPIRVDATVFTFTLPLTLLVMGLLTAVLRLTGRIDRVTAGVFLAVYAYFLYVYTTGAVNL